MAAIFDSDSINKDLLSGNFTVLVVDDDPISVEILEAILEDDFRVMTALSGAKAVKAIENKIPDLVLLDLHMPEMDGREALKKLRENEKWKDIPVIFMTSDASAETKRECIELGASDFILKPFVPEVVRSRSRHAIELTALRKALEKELEEKTQQFEQMSIKAIMVISSIIDAKDTYTSGHSERVARCSLEIAKRLGWSEEEAQNLYLVALLHDIGKIAIPDAILNKPSRLTDEEFDIIKSHTVIGDSILKELYMLRKVEEGALYHHERYDGAGYPCGVKGDSIPLFARIIGVADSYDAMSSNRVYREKLPREQIISEFERCSGTQFDPNIAGVFVSMLKEGFSIAES